jgi:GDP-L-fucose synthase
MTENMLMTGPLEPTNQWYAVAKIAAIKLCEANRRQHCADFVSVMPTNLYGPGDNYHPEDSHVPAALIRRFHEAKVAQTPRVIVWGTGTPAAGIPGGRRSRRRVRLCHGALFG